MKKTVLSFSLILFTLLVSKTATCGEAVGNWKTYLSYNNAQYLYAKESRIFCVASNNLFYIDKADLDDIEETNNYPAIYTTTKSDGLNDLKIRIAEFSKENNTTVIAYENGNIDLIKDNKIINIPFIKTKDIGTDKQINNITFIDNKAYLSCDFGIVVLSILKEEISETYYLGEEGSYLSVNDFCSDGQFFYAATNDGLKRASINDPFLMNSKQWSTITNIPGGTGKFTFASYVNNIIFAARDQGNTTNIYRLIDNTWSYTTSEYKLNNIAYNGDSYLFSFTNKMFILDTDFNITKRIQSIELNGETTLLKCNHAIWDSNKRIVWIADQNNSLIKYNIPNNTAEVFAPQGPASDNIFRMKFNNGVLKVVPGGRTSSWNNQQTPAAVYILNNSRWENVTNLKYNNSNIIDFVNLVDHPTNPDRFFVASWNYGIVEFSKKGDTYSQDTIWTEKNSTLHNIFTNNQYVRVDGMAFDEDNNLWVTNSQSPASIKILSADNIWHSLNFTDIDGRISLGEIMIDKNQTKWVHAPRGIGILAIDNSGDPSGKSKYNSVLLKIKDQDGKELSGSVINSYTFDKTGNLWIGLSEGIAVYYNPEDVFKSTLYASQVLIPRNDGTNLADPLLDGESITSIEVDGGNRKWIGTKSNGAFLVSDDGLTTLQHFTAENSELLSNAIVDIEIDQETGLVYIGTSEGLVSYQSDAKAAYPTFSNVHAFPNPARLSQTNTITVSGLVNETYVKITDANGNLVFETISNGGYASWNGNNLYGQRVSTGVYYIFCSTKDGTKTDATKVLIVK